MSRASLQFRMRWLRALLGALLALHIGMAQASMVHAAAVPAGVGSSRGAAPAAGAAPRCHGDAVTDGAVRADLGAAAAAVSAAAGAQGAPHAPCCASGDCHCAAACYPHVAAASVLIGIADHVVAARVGASAMPPPPLARELRPPISR
jgi:hypothetical protein